MNAQQAAMLLSEEESGKAASVPTLTLLRAYYNNFKGMGEVMLDAGGGNLRVFGKNGIGKTRLEDGILWLFHGKDSANREKFEVRPIIDEYGNVAHGLACVVEATFSYKDRAVILKKVLTETWTQKKGLPEKTLTGLSTVYYVDGVSKTETQYKAFIASIVDEKVFRLLTDPRYFNEQLHWEERRRILLEVCGDVSDADVIASDSRLYDLTAILGNRSLDDHRKMLKEDKTKTVKATQQIPVQIAEVQRGMAGVSGLDAEKLAADIRSARTDRQEKAQELARAEGGGAVADKQKRMAEISSKLLDLDIQARQKADAAHRAKKTALTDVQDKIAAAERDLRGTEGDLGTAKRQATTYDSIKEQLLKDWDAVDGETFAYADTTVCPTCNQDLPEERVQEAREKALEAFNLQKSERLDRIDAECAELREQIKAVQVEIKRCTEASDLLQKKIKALKAQTVPMQAEIDKAQAQAKPVTATPEYTKLAGERDDLQEQIEDIREGSQSATAAIKAELQVMDANITALEEKAAQVRQAEGARKRVAELQADEKRLAAEYEKLAKESDLADEAVKAKVRMLEGKINNRFAFATFKLFDVQMNGVVAECCETLYNGVPYLTNLNTGARINIGLDLINVFSEHYGFRAPVFIDNSESITSFIPVSSQVIKLIARIEDDVLRIEKEVVQ